MTRRSPLCGRGPGLLVLGCGLALAGLSVGGSPWGPAPLAAQNSCDLISSRQWNFVARGTPAETHWFTRALFVCRDGTRIYSDSAIVSPPQNLSQLFGNVSFSEEGRELTADRANYRTDIDRLDAFGNVVLDDSVGGSRIEGSNLVYLRAGSNRIQNQLTVTGIAGERPRAMITPRPPPPDTAVVIDSIPPDSVGFTFPDSVLTEDTLPGDTMGLQPAESGVDRPGEPDAGQVPVLDRIWLLRGWFPAVAIVWVDVRMEAPTSVVQEPDTTEQDPDTIQPDVEVADTAAAPPPDPAALIRTDTAATPVPLPVEPSVGVEESPPEPDPTPYTVLADRIVLDGESSFRAEGNAEVEREGLRAYGTNMVYSQEQGELLIAGNARSEGEDFSLTAQAITIVLPGDEVREIIARRQGALRSSDLDLTAPKIRIFVEDEALERLVAGPLSADDGPAFAGPVAEPAQTDAPADANRAVATGDDYTITADSLDVETPGEALERAVAVGAARVESFARDSLNAIDTPEIALHDWIEGDTVVATFARTAADSVPALDSVEAMEEEGPGRDYVLEQLVATGGARSLYRLEPTDTTQAGRTGLAIHYVVGSAITIRMTGGEIDRMEVSGDTRGWHLEPEAVALVADSVLPDTIPPSISIPGDTAVADTTLPPDTGAVDTTGVGSELSGSRGTERPSSPDGGRNRGEGAGGGEDAQEAARQEDLSEGRL